MSAALTAKGGEMREVDRDWDDYFIGTTDLTDFTDGLRAWVG